MPHLGTLDDICPFAGELVQQLQYALMRSMRFSVTRREDAYGFSRRGKEGGGLNRSYACPTRHFDSRGPSKNRALFNMLNDNAFPPTQALCRRRLDPNEFCPRSQATIAENRDELEF
jgi:hypothetical protein